MWQDKFLLYIYILNKHISKYIENKKIFILFGNNLQLNNHSRIFETDQSWELLNDGYRD